MFLYRMTFYSLFGLALTELIVDKANSRRDQHTCGVVVHEAEVCKTWKM